MLLLKILSGILNATVSDPKDTRSRPKTESQKRREIDKCESDLWVMADEYKEE